MMQSKIISVRCIYSEENCLLDMLEESFRLFLSRTISDDDGKVVFCER